jgi:prolyl-tRNA synthetase
LTEAGVDVLFDDRNESAGIKFKDADLIGIPTKVIIGSKNAKKGIVEIKDRKTGSIDPVEIKDLKSRFAK